MVKVLDEAAQLCDLPFSCDLNYISPGSTDMGDLSCVMPVVHGDIGGAEGTPHGKDYRIADSELACIKSAKVQLALLYIILKNGGAKATEIAKNFNPRFKSKKDYFEEVVSFNRAGDCITYNEQSASVKW